MANNKLDWKSLRTKAGHAGRVPAQVKALGSEDFEKRLEALRALRDQLVGHNEWYSASVPVLQLVCDSLLKMTEPACALVLTANIAAGEHSAFWANVGIRQANIDCVEALRPHVPAFFKYLSEDDRLRRCAATLVLSVTLSSKDTAEVSQLASVFEGEADPIVKASLLLCLSCLEDTNATKARCEPLLQSSSDWLRGAATLCLLVREANWDETLQRGLEGLLRLPVTDASTEEGRWPWFNPAMIPFSSDHTMHDPTTHALVAVADAGGAEVRERLTQCLLALGERTESGLCATRAMRILATFGGFQKRDAACLLGELTSEQAAMAKRLTHSRFGPAAMWGIPAAGIVRRRWAGAEPPRPLDTLVPNVLNPKADPVPLWYAWIQFRKKSFGVPPFVDETLKGIDRWEALAEFACAPFGYSHRRSVAELEAAFEGVVWDDAALRRVQQVAEEQVYRVSNAKWQLRYYPPSATACALVLIPWIRAGRVLPDEWLCLVEVGDYGHCGEILGALTPLQRDTVAQTTLDELVTSGSEELFGHTIQHLALLGTPSVVDGLRNALKLHQASLKSRAAKFKKALDAYVASAS
jgi:hypothetical protein